MSKALEELKQKKEQELLMAGRKTQYIKDKVFEYSEKWWKAYEEMANSDNKDERKAALAEFNKLQCRILPTEIANADNEGLVVKVVSQFVAHGPVEATEGDVEKEVKYEDD